ncbi:dihydrofolate reductase [Vibrio phage vB_VpaM_sm033]|nr:dihydrofolate reductase [Vibrio phage vB_VpaM_sm033]
MKQLTMVMAIDRNGALGRGNDLIIRDKKDMDFFKSVTKNKTTIMGYKTWLSIGAKPLPGRTAIVLTSTPVAAEIAHPGDTAFFVNCKEEALRIARAINRDAVVIGGGQVYREFQQDADVIWMTTWDTVIEDADVFLSASIYDGRIGETIERLTHKDGFTGLIRAYKWADPEKKNG